MKHSMGAIVLNVYLSCVMAWMVVMMVVIIVQLF